MKKRVLILSFAMMLMAGSAVTAQDQPKPKKDTVNIDTDAKPTFYYAEEEATESKGNTTTIVIIAGVAVILAGGFFFVMKRKK
jgi:LPXTG-motif cell wall-anchored protein